MILWEFLICAHPSCTPWWVLGKCLSALIFHALPNQSLSNAISESQYVNNRQNDAKLQSAITFKRLELETWAFERWKPLQFWEKMSPRKPKKKLPPGRSRGSQIHTGSAGKFWFLRFGLCRWACLFCNFCPFLRPYFLPKYPPLKRVSRALPNQSLINAISDKCS